MTSANLLLIVASAFIHVVAHVALKRSSNRTAFVWWMLLAGTVAFVPLVLTPWPALPLALWGVLFISSGCEALYFASIARAYQAAELSLVYPLARGTAPVLLLVWAVLLAGESPTPAGAAGIGVIALGLYLINLPALGAWVEPLRALGRPGPRWALAAGLFISLYTVLDRTVMRGAPAAPATWPLLYTYLALAITLVLLTPYALRSVGRAGLRREWQAARGWIVLSGLTTLGAYAMVLAAIRAGTPASYAGAVREISVVLGALVGVLVLKETGTVMRLLGSVCVAGGVAMIALFG